MTGNQKKIGIWVFMLAMAVTLLALPISVKAEEETTQTSEMQKEKLPAPQNVSISDGWGLSFDDVPEAHGYYRIEIIKDGEFLRSYKTISHHVENGVFKDSLVEYISETGAYSVKITALNDYDPDKYEESDSSQSLEKNYIRPDVALGCTVAVWDIQNPGKLLITPVENAGGYEFDLFTVDTDGELLVRGGIAYPGYSATEEFSIDFSDRIEQLGAGKYVVKVRALSGNPDEIANGEWGEASAVYDTGEQAATTDKILSDAVSGETSASDALNIVVNQVTKDKLGIDMQTNDNVLNQVKALEEKYAAEKGVNTTKIISEEAVKYINPENVSIVGAALNAEAGDISLDISVPEENVEIPGEVYAKSVQFDIKLKNGDTKIHDLKVPVTITMPVPEGIEIKHLVLLHFHETGEPERVVFKVNNDNTVTFTVKDFSVFVFAQNKEDAGEENKQPEKEPEQETETESEWEEEGTESEEQSENNVFRSPETSDTGHVGLYLGIFAASLLVMYVYDGRKKRSR